MEQISLQTEEMKQEKIGYVRVVEENQSYSYISYKDMEYWNEAQYENIKNKLAIGRCKIFCGCSAYNNLELTITKNNVVRVKNNLKQELHKDSCPKSVVYSAWIKETMEGVETADDNKIIFSMTLPGTGHGSNSSGTSGGGSSTSSEPKIQLYNFVKFINAKAWELQAYGQRKEISIAKRENRKPEIKYKELWYFSQLIYGVSNNIFIRSRSHLMQFSSMFYSVDTFYRCADYKQRFFVYAQVSNISEYKPERKYQYVTLHMPCNKSKSRTTLRIPTDKFVKMIDVSNITDIMKNTVMLSGWVNHSVFPIEGGGYNEWMTLLKGFFFFVSRNGLMIQDSFEGQVIDALCDHKIIFKRPYTPLENYQNMMPTALIELKQGKDILIDIAQKEDEYTTKLSWGETNTEYDCILLKPGDDVVQIIEMVSSKIRGN